MKPLGYAAAGVAVLWMAGALLLHVGQRRHNVMEVLAEAPDGKPGESIARAIASVMEFELSSITGWRPNRSSAVNTRPRRSGTRNVSKYSGVTRSL